MPLITKVLKPAALTAEKLAEIGYQDLWNMVPNGGQIAPPFAALDDGRKQQAVDFFEKVLGDLVSQEILGE